MASNNYRGKKGKRSADSELSEEGKQYLLYTVFAQMPVGRAVKFLSDIGYKITHTKYKQLREEMKDDIPSRIRRTDLVEQHFTRIAELETSQEMLWHCFNKTKSYRDKAWIVSKIVETQRFISYAYGDILAAQREQDKYNHNNAVAQASTQR